MQSFEKLIRAYATDYPDFEYYLKHAQDIRNHEEEHPDITIECSVSLLQGISKSIVYRLDPSVDREAFERGKLEYQVKEAFRAIEVQSDIVEIAFPRACSTVARIAGELRNQRGDISHGKAVPKEIASDASLARLALDVTEALTRYLFAHLIRLDSTEIRYAEFPELNAQLDQEGPKIGLTPYSRLLFEHDFSAYQDAVDRFDADREPAA
jgi:hypothetical protein